MPMQWSLYPEVLEVIAAANKLEANWVCEECGRPCLGLGESAEVFEQRLAMSSQLGYQEKLGRFVLTAAHLDHRLENCQPDSLRALCLACYCLYDFSQMARQQQLKVEQVGQLRIEGLDFLMMSDYLQRWKLTGLTQNCVLGETISKVTFLTPKTVVLSLMVPLRLKECVLGEMVCNVLTYLPQNMILALLATAGGRTPLLIGGSIGPKAMLQVGLRPGRGTVSARTPVLATTTAGILLWAVCVSMLGLASCPRCIG